MARRFTCLWIVAIAAPGAAQDKISTEFTLDVASKYVWRGINLVNDTVLQPNLSFESGGFNVSLWGNIEATSWNSPNYLRNPKGRVTEIDTTFSYGSSYRSASWSVGLIDYQFPGTGAERYREVYGSLAWDGIPGSPEIALYHGSKADIGTYGSLSLSHSLPIRSSSVDLGASLGFADKRGNNFLYGQSKAGLSDFHLSAATDLKVGRSWVLSPSVHYSGLLDRKHLEGDPRRSNLWMQVGLKTRF